MRREHPRKRSLDQVVDVFLADCQARNLSPRTIEHYDWAIRSYRASLWTDIADQVLADLEPECVRAWIGSLPAILIGPPLVAPAGVRIVETSPVVEVFDD